VEKGNNTEKIDAEKTDSEKKKVVIDPVPSTEEKKPVEPISQVSQSSSDKISISKNHLVGLVVVVVVIVAIVVFYQTNSGGDGSETPITG